MLLINLVITLGILGILNKTVKENDEKLVKKFNIVVLIWIVFFLISLFIYSFFKTKINEYIYPLILIIDVFIRNIVSIVPIILVIKNRKIYSTKRKIFLIGISILHILCLAFDMTFAIRTVVKTWDIMLTGIQVV